MSRLVEDIENTGALHWLGDSKEIECDPDRTDLAELVFNPEWVKGPIYTLIWSRSRDAWLSDKQIRERLDGSNPIDYLYRKLPFTDRDRKNILSLMQSCRIAFPVHPTTHQDGLLIPDLLHPQDAAPQQLVGPQVNRYQLQAEFIPERIFMRFLAEHYHEVKHGYAKYTPLISR